jgi:enoyl-CoA hydratase/carnithine racemase
LSEERGVVVVTLSRPEKLNAMTSSMWASLAEAVEGACGAGKPVVVTGEGRAFSAGDDIGEMYGLSSPGEAARFFSTLERAVSAMVSCRSPLVAAVNGLAVGGGAEILLLMDYVVASRSAWISFPEARIGLIPPILLTLGALQLGPRLARSLALSARRLTAEEAMSLGIVDEVVDGDPLPRALEAALELSSVPVQARAAIKAATMAYAAQASVMLRALESLVLSGEAKERMRLFLEKKL